MSTKMSSCRNTENIQLACNKSSISFWGSKLLRICFLKSTWRARKQFWNFALWGGCTNLKQVGKHYVTLLRRIDFYIIETKSNSWLQRTVKRIYSVLDILNEMLVSSSQRNRKIQVLCFNEYLMTRVGGEGQLYRDYKIILWRKMKSSSSQAEGFHNRVY